MPYYFKIPEGTVLAQWCFNNVLRTLRYSTNVFTTLRYILTTFRFLYSGVNMIDYILACTRVNMIDYMHSHTLVLSRLVRTHISTHRLL